MCSLSYFSNKAITDPKKVRDRSGRAEAERNKNIRLLSGDWCLVIERSDAGVPFLPNFVFN